MSRDKTTRAQDGKRDDVFQRETKRCEFNILVGVVEFHIPATRPDPTPVRALKTTICMGARKMRPCVRDAPMALNPHGGMRAESAPAVI